MGGGGRRGSTCFWSCLSWAERLSMRIRDCCSSSWAAPTRLLFLSADCLALSSWEGGHRVRAAGTNQEGGRDRRRTSLLQPEVRSNLPQDISGRAAGRAAGDRGSMGTPGE